MNDLVYVKGTGIVDVLTLSGKSEIHWIEDNVRTLTGFLHLQGDLELIVNGESVRGHNLEFLDEQKFIISGHRKYNFVWEADEDYYVMSIGGLKRFFFQQMPIKSFSGINDWNAIFKKKGEDIISNPGVGYSIIKNKNGQPVNNTILDLIFPLLPYWSAEPQNLFFLGKIEELNLLPLEKFSVNLEFQGEIKIPDAKVSLDGKCFCGENVNVNGTGYGKIYLENISIPPPLNIHSEYAKIGTGHLNLERNEMDGRVMYIDSLTSEELKNCKIVIESNDNRRPIYIGKILRAYEVISSASNNTFILSCLGTSALWSFMAAMSIREDNILSNILYIYGTLASLIFGAQVVGVPQEIKYRTDKKLYNARQFPFSQLNIKYEGTQTSRWLEKYPEYEKLGKQLTIPEK